MQKSIHEKSKDQEKRVAKSLQAVGDSNQTIASGRFWQDKADVRVKQMLLVECKTSGATDSKGRASFSIKKAWLDKVEVEAFRAGRGEIPCLAFSFDENKDYYVIEGYYFINMLKELQQLREEKEQWELRGLWEEEREDD